MSLFGEILEAANDPRMRHAAIVHLPVALSVLGVPVVLAFALTRARDRSLRRVVCGLYLTLLVAALVATRSGADARAELGDVVTTARLVIERHEWMAGKVWILALMTASAAACTSPRAARVPKVAAAARLTCTAGALACAAWVGLVGHLGGTAVYSYGAGTPAPLTDAQVDRDRHLPGGPDAAEELVSGDPRLQLFRTQVRPLLVRSCMGCHGPGESAASGLDVTSMTGMLAGGTRGPALVPGDPQSSLLFQVVSGKHPTLRMPLGKAPLSEEEVGAIRSWIEQGAVWRPRTATTTSSRPAEKVGGSSDTVLELLLDESSSAGLEVVD